MSPIEWTDKVSGRELDGRTWDLYEVTVVAWRCSNMAIVGIRDAKGGDDGE